MKGENDMEQLSAGEVAEYLQRISYPEALEPSKCVLDHLIQRHLQSVPFENLDICERGVVPSLKLEDLYEKIVIRKRGGYCYELNRLFCALLQALGFSVRPIAARVLWEKNYFPPLTHRATVVSLGSREYYCDVGYGGGGPRGALELKAGEQEVAGERFEIRDFDQEHCVLCRFFQGEFRPMLWIERRRVEEVDFEVMNFYSARSDDSIFRQKRVVSLCTETGKISLFDRKLTVEGKVHDSKQLETEAEVKKCLSARFHLE